MLLLRRLALAGLTANALRPPPGYRSGLASFMPGWLVGELAPQLLAIGAVDTAVQVARGRTHTHSERAALALSGASAAGLGLMMRSAMRDAEVLEQALVDGLGLDYADQLDAPPTPAELATPWRSLLTPFRLHDPRIRVERGIPYAPYGRRGELDIYRPPAETAPERSPVLLQVHGGGWTLGRKDQQGLPLMLHLAARGWTCVSINYRLAPRDPFPAQIIDVKAAIHWVKEHIADYGGDPGHIAITGGSAGGHLAALAALTPGDPDYQPGFEDADTSVQACVPFYGVYDWAGVTETPQALGMRDGFLVPRIVQQPFESHRELYEKASPLLRVTDEAPDFFLIHGRLDTLADVRQARLLATELRRRSRARVVYAELPGAQHAFDVFTSIRTAHTIRAAERFLRWQWHRRRVAG